jgi:hypothetical protein
MHTVSVAGKGALFLLFRGIYAITAYFRHNRDDNITTKNHVDGLKLEGSSSNTSPLFQLHMKDIWARAVTTE